VATSPYLDRPRGVTGIGEEESGAFVQIVSGVGEPMRPSTRVEVVAGLVVRGLGGRGGLPVAPDPSRYDRAYLHCEVLVVGGGAAGVQAATDAVERGEGRIVLVHDGPLAMAVPDAIQVLQRTTVTGLFDAGHAVALERRTEHLLAQPSPDVARMRVWHIRSARTVLATGAFERPLAFADNDRPGVLLAGAAATYATRHGVAWGRAVVVCTDDTGLAAALALHDAGTAVAVVADVRTGLVGDAVRALAERGIDVRQGWSAVGTDAAADGGVAAVELTPVTPQGVVLGPGERVPCDLVAVNGGWSPNVALFTYVGGPVTWDATRVAFVADRARPHLRSDVTVVGSAAGDGPMPANPPATFFGAVANGPDIASRVFIDPGRDATLADLHRALGAGLRSVEHVKRYTTIGTGADQGRTSGVLAIGLMAATLGVSPGEVGTTTFRPPYVPLPFAALAGRDRGRLSDPERVTAMHDWHVEHGAVFEVVGQWQRPHYFASTQDESMADAVLRECAAVRTGVGMMDASTLGKIDVRGPDAATFLDRLYTNVMSKLQPGRARYGVMCGADGMVLDDGVVLRLAGDHFLVTTTTGGAARVLEWMEEWLQTEWPDLRVWPTSVTDQIATVVVAGPGSRDVVAAVVSDLDVSKEALRYLAHAETAIAGAPGRVTRVSFSGELAFELMVPAWYGDHVWRAAWQAGQAHGVTAYGTEAMHVLRAEKGFVIVGQETDGTQTPDDLGLSWLVRKPVDRAGNPTPDFIGSRSFARADTRRPHRKQLVGLLPVDPQRQIPEGAQLVAVGADLSTTPVPMLGHVTSSYRSAELDRTFALALVAGGADRHGERLLASFGADDAEVVITSPVFLDPEGARRDG